MKLNRQKIENKGLDNLTLAEQKSAKDYKAEKETEEVLEAGQENEKQGMKVIAEQVTKERADRRKQEEELLNKMDMKKRSRYEYKVTVASSLLQQLHYVDWLNGWEAELLITDGTPVKIDGKMFETKDGILLVVFGPKGQVYHQGMLVTNEPAVDFVGANTLALQVENQMDKERGSLIGVLHQRSTGRTKQDENKLIIPK